MNEDRSTEPASVATAGTLLKQARQARGLHLMALSAALKVPPARLEAMEEDRWHELVDAAYARTLAHTVSRALGIDPEPVLRGLPAAPAVRLETLNGGLDEPFRERRAGAAGTASRHRLSVVGAGLVLALGVWWWLDAQHEPARPAAAEPAAVAGLARSAEPAAASAAPSASAPGTPNASAASPAGTDSAPGAGPAAAGSSGGPSGMSSATPAGTLSVRLLASQASWIEVRDAQGQARVSRLLGSGEPLELALAAPAALTVGNASATRLWVNGQAVDLSAATRENVARLELR